MDRPPRDVVDLALLLVEQFEEVGLDYALGGALALGFWGTPRGTLDVDVTIFVTSEELDRANQALLNAGCSLDEAQARDEATRRGTFRALHSGMRIDVFVPDIELYGSARQRRRQVMLEGHPVLVWSPEDLILFKLLYFRRKDEADVEDVVHMQGGRLDAAYIRRWLVGMMGEDDERTRWWDGLIKEQQP